MPVIEEEDDSDHNNMLRLCSELIRLSATKIKGYFFFVLFAAVWYFYFKIFCGMVALSPWFTQLITICY